MAEWDPPNDLGGLDGETKVRPKEVTMAASLIETKAAGGEASTVEGREEATDDDKDCGSGKKYLSNKSA